MRMKLLRWILLFLLVFCCSLLQDDSARGSGKEDRRGKSGAFDFYVLSLSWSPQYCAQAGRGADDTQCGKGRQFGFVVHGLWPQYNNGGWPQFCSAEPNVSENLIEKMMPIMPSRQLIRHEWAKHGTCSGLPPQDYFQTITRTFQSIRIPAEYQSPLRQIYVKPADIKQKLTAANPGWKEENIRIYCSGRFLSEVRVCLTRDLEPRQCTGMRDGCRRDSIIMQPIR